MLIKQILSRPTECQRKLIFSSLTLELIQARGKKLLMKMSKCEIVLFSCSGLCGETEGKIDFEVNFAWRELH